MSKKIRNKEGEGTKDGMKRFKGTGVRKGRDETGVAKEKVRGAIQ